MAIDDATSAAPVRTPSLLAGRSDAGARDSQSSRILAALEGRAPQPERQHMPAARTRPSRAWWLLLVLLVIGAGGGAAWWRGQHRGHADEMPVGSVMVHGGNGQAGAAGAAAHTAAANGAAASMPAANGANGAGSANQVAAANAPPPAAAAIVDAPGSDGSGAADARRDDEPPPSNPLSALAAAAPAAVHPAAVQAADGRPADGKSPDGKSLNGKTEGKAAGRNTRSARPKKKSDGDAALLSALMAYGLPPPSVAAPAAPLPGTPLSERLQQCRRKPFLESEQCRLQVCAGQWGLAPECPNPQAQTQTQTPLPMRP